MVVPDKVPKELAALLRRMVAIPTSTRPSLREVHAELLRLHGTFSSAGHVARYLRTVWGVPRQAPPAYSGNTGSISSTSQNAKHSFKAILESIPSKHSVKAFLQSIPSPAAASHAAPSATISSV